VAVVVDGWQWMGGSGKKMSEIGRVLMEIRMIDDWLGVAVAVDGSGSGSGSGWVAVAVAVAVAVVGWQWMGGSGKKMTEIG
jgi:hypothetical protein